MNEEVKQEAILLYNQGHSFRFIRQLLQERGIEIPIKELYGLSDLYQRKCYQKEQFRQRKKQAILSYKNGTKEEEVLETFQIKERDILAYKQIYHLSEEEKQNILKLHQECQTKYEIAYALDLSSYVIAENVLKDNKGEILYQTEKPSDRRNMKLLKDFLEGMQYNELAEKYHLQESTIKNSIFQMTTQKRKKREEILEDMKKGMSDEELQRKHLAGKKLVQSIKRRYLFQKEMQEKYHKKNLDNDAES